MEEKLLELYKEYFFEVEAVTPVHVGTGKEKSYTKGLDFYYNKNGEYIFYSQNKVLKKLQTNEVATFSSALANGDVNKIVEYLEKRQLITDKEITNKFKSAFGNANDINSTCKTINGSCYLPGSSIKGALRSWIARAIKPNHNSEDLVDLLGPIEANLMRFIQVSDVEFAEKPIVCPTKIFCGDGLGNNKNGLWKDQFKGVHNAKFSENKFVTFYEMLPSKSKSQLRIVFPENADDFAKVKGMDEYLKTVPNIEKLFSELTIPKLIDTFREYTNNYIDKEISFFETYKNESYTAIFIKELKRLKQLNTGNSFLMRVGQGIGFHSITGDWKFSSSHSDLNLLGEKFGSINYKTRKLIFDKKGGEFEFVFPGYIKLTLKEKSEINFDLKRTAITVETSKENIVSKTAQIEAIKPIVPVEKDFNLLKDQEIVYSKVKGQEGLNVLIEPLVNNLPLKTICKVRYAAGFELDSIIEIKINFPDKKNRKQFNFCNPRKI